MEVSGDKRMGQMIRDCRKRKGFTQEELASRIGKSKRTVQHYEAGTTAIPFDTLQVITNVLGMSMRDLLPDLWGKISEATDILRKELQKEPRFEEVAVELDLPTGVVEVFTKEINAARRNDSFVKEKKDIIREAAALADYLRNTLKHTGVADIVHFVKDERPVFCFFLNSGDNYIVSYEQALSFWERSQSIGYEFIEEIEANCQKATLSF